MSNINKVIGKLDYNLLHEQRLAIARILDSQRQTLKLMAPMGIKHPKIAAYEADIESLEGVLNFLDSLQDASTDDGLFQYPDVEDNEENS